MKLDEAKEEALQRLSIQGITSLPDYVEYVIKSRLSDGETGNLVPSSRALANSFTTVEENSLIKHRPPQVGLTIDGVEYEPRDVARFNGQPLHYIATSGKDGVALTASTDGAGIKSALTSHVYASALRLTSDATIQFTGGCPPRMVYDPTTGSWIYVLGPCPDGGGGSGGAPEPEPKPWEVPYRSLKMFSDINFSGDWFWLAQGWGYSNLLKVERDKGIFSSDDWNDKISSMTATANAVTYYEHINFKGSTLTIPGGEPQNKYANIHALGWGDRISSVNHW
ncbi:hypothetical protein [Rhodococcus sp. NCIMB 12038]|uniref:hypothetical protein n=1 Tax=Rhodococcus sp. NCIMB 12038 TaxID=933800 RepID=UPI00117A5A9F|nr:hypothetical protein [Rhodococcus sp. NCIMB 12038]